MSVATTVLFLYNMLRRSSCSSKKTPNHMLAGRYSASFEKCRCTTMGVMQSLRGDAYRQSFRPLVQSVLHNGLRMLTGPALSKEAVNVRFDCATVRFEKPVSQCIVMTHCVHVLLKSMVSLDTSCSRWSCPCIVSMMSLVVVPDLDDNTYRH
jgi:hypothetical protein